MKKIILMLCLAFQISQAQDSSIVKINKRIDKIQLNLERSHDLYVNAIELHCAGFMTSLIGVIGYKFDYMNKNQFYNTLAVAGSFHLSGIGVTWYSHRFILKASIK